LTLTVEQSETLKYFYLLFSDPNIFPFEGERYMKQSHSLMGGWLMRLPSCVDYVFTTEVRDDPIPRIKGSEFD
jgi:hypothetical protein